MTIRELGQLFYLEGLIAKETERLQDLRDATDVKAQVITDMPRGGGAKDKLGEVVPQIVDTEAQLKADIERYMRQKERLQRYIDRVPNARMKMIMILRFIDQKQWKEIADIIGGKETEYSVKAACYRYVEGRDEAPATLQGQISLFDTD